MAKNFTKSQTPTRELRKSQASAEVRLPVAHRIVIGIIAELSSYHGNGTYIGKIHTSLGSQPITVYDQDENLKDFISKNDDPAEWLLRFADEVWGAAAAREAVELLRARLPRKGQDAQKGSEA